jgi:hypothetical protein
MRFAGAVSAAKHGDLIGGYIAGPSYQGQHLLRSPALSHNMDDLDQVHFRTVCLFPGPRPDLERLGVPRKAEGRAVANRQGSFLNSSTRMSLPKRLAIFDAAMKVGLLCLTIAGIPDFRDKNELLHDRYGLWRLPTRASWKHRQRRDRSAPSAVFR